jgi:hypothetical protein
VDIGPSVLGGRNDFRRGPVKNLVIVSFHSDADSFSRLARHPVPPLNMVSSDRSHHCQLAVAINSHLGSDGHGVGKVKQ